MYTSARAHSQRRWRYMHMKKLLNLIHVNDSSGHIPLPFLISTKLGDLTRWWPTMLRKRLSVKMLALINGRACFGICRLDRFLYGTVAPALTVDSGTIDIFIGTGICLRLFHPILHAGYLGCNGIHRHSDFLSKA